MPRVAGYSLAISPYPARHVYLRATYTSPAYPTTSPAISPYPARHLSVPVRLLRRSFCGRRRHAPRSGVRRPVLITIIPPSIRQCVRTHFRKMQ